jgi:hypothetical protein
MRHERQGRSGSRRRKGSESELRTFWMDQLSMGREVIPAGDSNACPGFDYKMGCPGHGEGA